MKKVIAIAPTVYQLRSVNAFGASKKTGNGSFIFEQVFETEQEAKQYLIERAQLYFENEDELTEAIESIEKYGSLTMDAVTGGISDFETQTKYVVAFDSGAKGTRYVDEENSKYGTSDEYSAKYFDTKEQADIFATDNGISGWVSEIEIEA